MSAGTVISGGFPGRIAQEVTPNQKCEGCLHYDRQVGRTGACTIGDSPWKCGDGDAREIGYAPIVQTRGVADAAGDSARAPEVEPQHVGGLYGSGSTRPVEIRQVSLGEEHVHLVKSLLARHAELQKSQCLRCSMRGSHGTAPHNVDPQMCSCRSLEAGIVAKAVVARMSNAQRASISLDNVTQWVRDVAKAGFRLPVPKKASSLGGRTPPEPKPEVRSRMALSDQIKIDDTGGHLRPTAAKKPTSAPAVKSDTSKSMYSEDWIAQFKGTDLFDEARKLCEQEFQMEEEVLKRRRERIKQEKIRSKAANTIKPDHDWQEQDMQRDKVRIAKQRLTLKLAEHHQKQMKSKVR